MTCSVCQSALSAAPLPSPPASHQARRVDSQISCSCGVVLQISTVEGWERWYVLSYDRGGSWRVGPEAREFVERLTDSQFTA